MFSKSSEKGQALIVIALAAIVLFGITALVVDGSRSMEDRRHAQNAADTAAMAAALAYSRGNDLNLAATDRAESNGYDGINNNTVTITVVDTPAGICPAGTDGKDITVDIATQINTSIGKVIGQNVLHNYVSATARACGTYYGPPFNGNAIVALGPSGIGFDAHGNTSVSITGGGILSNSSGSPSAWCGGSAEVSAPSVSVAGTPNLGSCYTGDAPVTVPQIQPSDYLALFPRQPTCNGNASFSGGQWHEQTGADGSKVLFDTNSDMDFAPGLYCVTNSGTFNLHGSITGNHVTFYFMMPSFTMKYNGAGANLTATSPISGEYAGILLYLAPQFDSNGNLIQTQDIAIRGNGNTYIAGSIIAPSASVTLYANSSNKAINSQIIAYNVDNQGGATVNISYKPTRNYNVNLPNLLALIK